ncbi:MAG: ThuA domain-containing protein [Planctomycetota bacterium]
MAKAKKKKALIVYGGWKGHQPLKTSRIIKRELTKNGFTVNMQDNLDVLTTEDLQSYDLLSTHWTMGEISGKQAAALTEAVKSGVGFAGFHGGAGDAFRNNTEFQTMVGGQFVGHPYVGEYRIYVDGEKHEITDDIKDFDIVSTERYYMHVDPANTVIASCRDGELGNVRMPVAWVKSYGAGRVYYNSLGHDVKAVSQKEVKDFIIKGMIWASARK